MKLTRIPLEEIESNTGMKLEDMVTKVDNEMFKMGDNLSQDKVDLWFAADRSIEDEDYFNFYYLLYLILFKGETK